MKNHWKILEESGEVAEIIPAEMILEIYWRILKNCSEEFLEKNSKENPGGTRGTFLD